MQFGLDISQHQLTWEELRSRAQLAEALGFHSAWVFDHFQPLYGDPDGPCLEGWTLLAALAASTDRIRLGPLVTGVTYRHPSLLTTEVLTVDHISNGRINLGIGAAWHEPEHRQLGFEFPRAGERIDLLEDALQIYEKLMTGEKVDYEGKHFTLADAHIAPEPLQKPHPPIWIGAGGKRMLRVVAQHADVWHSFGGPDDLGPKSEQISQLARDAGRDPAQIERSASISMEDAFNDIHTQIAKWDELGFTHLIAGWPPQGDELVGEFAREFVA